MIIGERLRGLRREKNLSKRDLVSALPLNYSTYANYESGFREPGTEVLQVLSQYFNVSVDYIIGTTDNRRRADDVAVLSDPEHDRVLQYRALDEHGREIVDLMLKKEYERVNISNEKAMPEHKQMSNRKWVSLQVYQQRALAGLGDYLNTARGPQYEVVRFMSTPVSERADFCVCIRGDAMEPKIRDNDIVFVKSMPQVDADSIGIFTYEGAFFCKRLRADPQKGAVYLESLNRSFAPKLIERPDCLRTVGLVIGVAEHGGK